MKEPIPKTLVSCRAEDAEYVKQTFEKARHLAGLVNDIKENPQYMFSPQLRELLWTAAADLEARLDAMGMLNIMVDNLGCPLRDNLERIRRERKI